MDLNQQVAEVPNDDLLALADFVEGMPGGLDALQKHSLIVAPFRDAPPSPQHVALALLLLEGAIELLTTNWDTCIERAVPGAHIAGVVTDDDRMQYQRPMLYKVHGCALRPSTLLITTGQLKATPVWATADVASALGHASVVFVGIGDVAPYVGVRLTKLISGIGVPGNVRIVGTSVASGWLGSQWEKLLPGLDDANKLEMSASAFADDLLRAWVWIGFRRCAAAAHSLPGLAAAFTELRDQLTAYTAPQLLQWLRGERATPSEPTSAMHCVQAIRGLLAAAVWSGGKAVTLRNDPGLLEVDGEPLHLMIGSGTQPGPKIAALARDRVARLRALGAVSPTSEAHVLCSGHIGRLEPTSASTLQQDIIGEGDPLDVIDGPAVGPVHLHVAEAIIETSEDA